VWVTRRMVRNMQRASGACVHGLRGFRSALPQPLAAAAVRREGAAGAGANSTARAPPSTPGTVNALDPSGDWVRPCERQRPFYPSYEAQAAGLGQDEEIDQQLAGLYMWIPAGIILDGVRPRPGGRVAGGIGAPHPRERNPAGGRGRRTDGRRMPLHSARGVGPSNYGRRPVAGTPPPAGSIWPATSRTRPRT
jgi:hypothetical protein